jgi:V8-like Glu-specific endopeptidase
MNNSPLSQDELTEYYKERPAIRSSLGSISKTFFIAGNGEPPRVETRIHRTEVQLDDGTTRYELRVDVDGVELGARTKVSGLNRIGVRGPVGDPPLDSELLSAFVPDHLAFDLRPKKRVRPHIRIPRELEDGIRYNTTIFGDEDRDVFRDTSYPWGAFGRCETNFGPFSGVMIGPRHILTCNHGVDWTPPPGYDADWLTFAPSYYDGDEPFGSTYATHVYVIQKDDNDGFSNGDEGSYDYAVLVLNDRIGERTGWLGTRRYTDAWDTNPNWCHIGYPQDLTSSARPTYQRDITIDGDDDQDDSHEIIYHQADVYPGQSGGPFFGFWAGDVGPRAVAVQSWQSDSTNGASGGGDLVDLAIAARNDFP